MEKRTQLTIMLENRPGALSEVVGALAKAKVNIQAISINDGVHHGVLKVVPAQPDAATKALKKVGVPFSEQKVYAVALADRAGALAEACGLLAAEGINIDFLYGSSCNCSDDGCSCGCDAVLILSLAEAKSAEKALGKKKAKKAKKAKGKK